jgi:hypothetical protein
LTDREGIVRPRTSTLKSRVPSAFFPRGTDAGGDEQRTITGTMGPRRARRKRAARPQSPAACRAINGVALAVAVGAAAPTAIAPPIGSSGIGKGPDNRGVC